MKAWHLRATLAVWAACLIPASSAAEPQDSLKAKLASDSELRSVLLQARDAVVAESHLQHGYQTVIETDVKRVTRYLLQTGNRAEVLYLQEHLHEYGKEIRGALEPAETPADFAARAQAAEKETNPYGHDEDIELIVEQEIERGFLEDALEKTKLMRVQMLQVRCMGEVALRAYDQVNLKIAEQAVAAAIERGKSNEVAPGWFFDPQRMLLELANAWFEGGYENAALKARQAAKGLLEADTSGHQYQGYWRDLGQAAAQQGDLKMAAEMLDHLSESDDRALVLNEMKKAQTTMTSPQQALQIAKEMPAGGFKFGVLRKIAQRQFDAGDKGGAAHTLQLAMEASKEDEQFRVFWMADVAWEQIRMEDRAGAVATIAEAIKENETHRWGSDQVNGWMMLAEDLAYMGEYDQALMVARKNEDAGSRARALQLVAYRETQAGHGDWAIAWGQGIEDPEGRARTFVGIAAGLIEQITGKDEDIIQY